ASQAGLCGEPSGGVQGSGGWATRGAGGWVDDRRAFECIAACVAVRRVSAILRTAVLAFDHSPLLPGRRARLSPCLANHTPFSGNYGSRKAHVADSVPLAPRADYTSCHDFAP